MSVSCIIPQIVENEELENEETDNEHGRRNENVLTDVDVIDSMEETCSDDTEPETLNTLHLRISFPAKCFLTE